MDAESGSATIIIVGAGSCYSVPKGLLLSPDGLYAVTSTLTVPKGIPDGHLVQILELKDPSSTVQQTSWTGPDRVVLHSGASPYFIVVGGPMDATITSPLKCLGKLSHRVFWLSKGQP